MNAEIAPVFHWVYGKKAIARKDLAESFHAQSKDISLRISEDFPDGKLPESEKPDFWVVSSGEDPPEWMMKGTTPIIQFHWSDFPQMKSRKNSQGLITPYIPKPKSFKGLVDLFRDSLHLWASPYFHEVQRPGKRRRLVIIEDEEAHKFLMQEALKEIGFRSGVIFFESGSIALDELKKMEKESRLPLLLFLDLMLPGMGGDEVLKTIKDSEFLRSTPVAILTGAQAPEELAFLKEMPRHFCFKLPLLESDAIDLLNRCFAFFQHARPIP